MCLSVGAVVFGFESVLPSRVRRAEGCACSRSHHNLSHYQKVATVSLIRGIDAGHALC